MNDYYNNNAKAFFEGTVGADMTEHYAQFLQKLTKGAHILDAGCGSGRDSLYFIKQGYKVTAMDAAEELCKLAEEYIGQRVLNIKFQDIAFENTFDGIWACASLLHVPSTELEKVLRNLKRTLKQNGIMYVSFKYGDFEGIRNGRYFHDLTEEKAEKLFTKVGLNIEKMWITKDVRADHVDEMWLNIIIQKY